MSSPCTAKSLLRCEMPADHQPLDLGGAFVNLANANIAIDPPDRAIVEIAIASVNLDCIVADLLSHIGSEQLRHRAFLRRWTAGIAQTSGVQHHQLGGLKRCGHVRDLEGHCLVFYNR